MKRTRTWQQIISPDLSTDILRDEAYRFERVISGEIGPPGFCGTFPVAHSPGIDVAWEGFMQFIDGIALWWLRRRRAKRARWNR